MLIVVKMGGSILGEDPTEIVSDIKNVLSGGQVVLVHGGGKEVTEVASQLGKTQDFAVSPEGFRSRYTDVETIEIFTMVMAGKINKQIVSKLQSQGISAWGVSGLDGCLIRAERKKRLVVIDNEGRKRVIDGGFTGEINEVNADMLKLMINNGYLPVVSPLAIGQEFEPLNVDGDRAAAHIAGALKAHRLVLLTDVEGLMLNGKLVPKLNISEVKSALPRIGKGMITKVYAAKEAVEMGVSEVLISAGLKRLPLSSALKHECGTVITRE
jgi:acetylglutamate/LysW-gamma-L-alpha-aminoadipate kinase